MADKKTSHRVIHKDGSSDVPKLTEGLDKMNLSSSGEADKANIDTSDSDESSSVDTALIDRMRKSIQKFEGKCDYLEKENRELESKVENLKKEIQMLKNELARDAPQEKLLDAVFALQESLNFLDQYVKGTHSLRTDEKLQSLMLSVDGALAKLQIETLSQDDITQDKGDNGKELHDENKLFRHSLNIYHTAMDNFMKEIEQARRQVESSISDSQADYDVSTSADKQMRDEAQDKEMKNRNTKTSQEVFDLRSKLQTNVEELKRKEDELDEMAVQREKLSSKILELRTTLKAVSKGMSKKLSQDESSLEIISSANRPSNIAEKYTSLLENEWLDAKDELDTVDEGESLEENKTKFLCQALMTTFNLVEKYYNSHLRRVRRLLEHPFESGSISSDPDTSPNLDEEDFHSITCYIKERSDTTGIETFLQNMLRENTGEFYYDGLKDDKALTKYIQASGVLSWKMIVQKPKMTFQLSGLGAPPDKDKHDIYSVCPKYAKCTISSFVSPMLVCKDKCLAKGKVFVTERK